MPRKRKYTVRNRREPERNEPKNEFVGFFCPVDLKKKYKLLCGIRNITMSQELRGFMRDKVEITG